MTIPKSQIETWSSQGAIATSKNTYASVKSAVEEIVSPLTHLTVDTYLSGSYLNDTNVYAESDVDVIVALRTWNGSGLAYTNLTDEQRAALEIRTVNFIYANFKKEIVQGLQQYYKQGFIKEDNKAVKLLPNGNRRPCDIIIAVPFNFYFSPISNVNKKEGIKFYTLGGDAVINFPKIHSENATTIHQNSNTKFKGVVRVFKNIRNHLATNNGFNMKSAPSYFLECFIGNVPTTQYTTDLYESFINVAKYLLNNGWDNYYCLNKIRPLFGDSNEQWNKPDAQNFLAALVNLHDNWK